MARPRFSGLPRGGSGVSIAHGIGEPVAQFIMITALERSARLLTERLAQLEHRLQAGDESAWTAYTETVKALALVVPNLAPERRGELLTTGEMARRLGVTPKTLLKRKARGQIRPALQAGKLIRWKGSETM
jgi:hypothetical protein